jgi:alpha-galactosidase
MPIDLYDGPDTVRVTAENETYSLSWNGRDAWEGRGVTVSLDLDADTSRAVRMHAPSSAIRFLHLHWGSLGGVPEEARLLGDHWERGYGDLEWRGIVPERRMPWYMLSYRPDNGLTAGIGVETGGAAIACWQADTEGVTLVLDVSCGGRGVLLGERTLTAARLHTSGGEGDGSPFEAARTLCRKLCPNPRLPDHIVYGSNNWYYAYGHSSHEDILRDTDILASHAPEGEYRPYMVIDDGWQANRLASDWATGQRGPWDSGNAKFPDMPGLAAAIRDRGARPGIWIRPLTAPQGTSENLVLPDSRLAHGITAIPTLDPSIPEVRAQIVEDFRRLRGWGYELIKHDWTTCDIFGRWGFDMFSALTKPGWHFADRSRTTAEIINDMYDAIREGAGDSVIISCNAVGHLAAGKAELHRTGDDTSGQEWERTRKMGINTLAFRMPQHDAFFAADADCVGLTNEVPWHLNRQWLDLLARSGTPLFVSTDPKALGPEQSAALKDAFAHAAVSQPVAEPLDWLHTTCPRRWKFGAETVTYNWYDGD